MIQNFYVGRFAPSPTGPLHYGSLVAATASYLQAKSNNGQWLVRIEDIDPPREIPGSADNILKTLENFQFEWDQAPLYQSQRDQVYRSVIEKLIKNNHIYACSCSRKDLNKSVQKSELGKRYPGNCVNKNLDLDNADYNLRLRIQDEDVTFHDANYGRLNHNLYNEIGDIIIYRKAKLPSYALAVSIDDAFQNITEVVRGYDLLAFTPVQIHICQLLDLPIPKFLHVPILVNQQNQKLSKQTGADAVSEKDRESVILKILQHLGQAVPSEIKSASLKQIWEWAFENWNAENIPKIKHICIS